MSAREENLEKALRNIGTRLVLESRINLDRARKKDTGKLRRSLKFQVTETSDSYTINLLATKYARYIDKGRPPSRQGGKTPGEVRTSIEGWVRRNRFRLRGSAANMRRDNRRGDFSALKDYQVRGLAFIISQKIHKYGFVGIEFITDAFKTMEPFITKNVASSYKKDIMKAIEKTINQV